MQIRNGTVIRKLNEGTHYWFVLIETETRNGRVTKRVTKNYRSRKDENPTLDSLLDRIRKTFSADLTKPDELGD
jgi:hypothetical protein